MVVHTVICQAPGRVNLIGDHTDHDGGLALPFALPLRTQVTARRRTDDVVVALSASQDAAVRAGPETQPGEVVGWGAYVAGVCWALRRAGFHVPGADLGVESDVPVGVGLSSSHALQIAVAYALLALDGAEPSRGEVVEIVQASENEYVGVPSGLLDQLAILSAREGHLVLVDVSAPRASRAVPVPCDLDAAGLSLLVVDSGAAHALDDGGYAHIVRDLDVARRAVGASSLRALGEQIGTDDGVERVRLAVADERVAARAQHVLTENERVRRAVALCREGRVREIGPLLAASHASMRRDLRNSDPVVDATVETLAEAGALGARMTGGGFGGSVVALVDRPRAGEAREAVRRTYAAMGRPEPAIHQVQPARGVTVRPDPSAGT